MKKIITASLLTLTFSLPTIALCDTVMSPFYVGAYGGYGKVSGAYSSDGDFAQGRLALGLSVTKTRALLWGAEIGVQSGNEMRLSASSAIIAATGGLPIQSTLKPTIDLLVTVQGALLPSNALFAFLKGGIAFRQLQLEDRTSSVDTLHHVNGELQAGIGTQVTMHTKLVAFYQGIYSRSNAGVQINAVGDTTIAHIPTQQAGFLGVEYAFS